MVVGEVVDERDDLLLLGEPRNQPGPLVETIPS